MTVKSPILPNGSIMINDVVCVENYFLKFYYSVGCIILDAFDRNPVRGIYSFSFSSSLIGFT